MDYNFNGHIQRAETIVRIKAQDIPQRDSFHYLGSKISKDGEIGEDVKHRIKVKTCFWSAL